MFRQQNIQAAKKAVSLKSNKINQPKLELKTLQKEIKIDRKENNPK